MWENESSYVLRLIPAVHLTELKLRRFEGKGPGWHYGEGRAIDATSLARALSLHQEAVRMGLLETDAFPGLNGEVMFTVYANDHYLEFALEADGAVAFCHEEADREVCYREGLSFEEARAKLREFKRGWSESEFLAESTTISEGRDFRALHLRITESIPGFPSSVWIVSTKQQGLSASISGDITTPSPMSSLSSGVFQQRHYLPATG